MTSHLITPSPRNRDVPSPENIAASKGMGTGRVRVAGRSGLRVGADPRANVDGWRRQSTGVLRQKALHAPQGDDVEGAGTTTATSVPRLRSLPACPGRDATRRERLMLGQARRRF